MYFLLHDLDIFDVSFRTFCLFAKPIVSGCAIFSGFPITVYTPFTRSSKHRADVEQTLS